MWNNYPGQQQRHQHRAFPQPGGGYTPASGPPGFPSPPSGFGGGFGGGEYAPPPGPPPSGGDYQFRAPPGPPPGHQSNGYTPAYVPPPGPPSGYGGRAPGGYGGSDRGYMAPNGPSPVPRYDSRPSYGGGAPHMPPNEVQNYGPQYQGADNATHQYNFRYSQCTGKKKALCIGINYIGQKAELKGCINDVHNVQRFLSSHGYNRDDIVTLTDDARNQRQLPTKQNIIDAMQWLVRGASPNDSLFFHYSGHGGQTKDLDGDEADGYDEVIYPLDFEIAGHIVDDDMHAIMVRPLPAGCRLTAIFDSCHSGSVLDLPYIYSTEGKIKEPNLTAEVGQGLFGMAKSYAQHDMGGVIKGAMGLFKTASGNTQKAEEYSRRTRTSSADVISWSGCKDSQTSADTVEAGRATGAMSYAFISALNEKPQQTYQELLNNLRNILRSKYSQKPQLSSSHPMDTSIYFIF
ncbi:MCA1_2 [Sanghuangporus sanghuang]